MSEEIFRVQRTVMAYWKPAYVNSRYGTVTIRMTLSDDVRFQMGGDDVAFFNGDAAFGKPVLTTRVPDPKWAGFSVG